MAWLGLLPALWSSVKSPCFPVSSFVSRLLSYVQCFLAVTWKSLVKKLRVRLDESSCFRWALLWKTISQDLVKAHGYQFLLSLFSNFFPITYPASSIKTFFFTSLIIPVSTQLFWLQIISISQLRFCWDDLCFPL